ncbi:tyrosine-protein kinase Fer-like isoform X2 [Anneissia japonica]|uniref:tyrosine-protein kinase Fer-like isoform X2 n=1 Tax=Anneissia japonica TaxID=1529436 RepID=UPI0014259F70|nr:tyrosine-protein kinase Fer-like isoform X2 [Anneissia japonica]
MTESNSGGKQLGKMAFGRKKRSSKQLSLIHQEETMFVDPNTPDYTHTLLSDEEDGKEQVSLLELSNASSLFNELNESFSRHSNVSSTPQMGFGTDLQSRTAHEALLKLNDQEIKLMETFRRVAQKRVCCDREYATALAGVSNLANRFDVESQLTHNSVLVTAWTTFIKESEKTQKLIRQNAETMNSNLIEKLSALIREKNDAKRQYMQERHRIDSEFVKAKEDVKENLAKYHRLARETKDSKLKYEEAIPKAKPRDLEKSKDKYRKSTNKLHKIHNDYLLSLRAAELHQEHYRQTILPRLLQCLQETQESQVSQLKQIMLHMAHLTNTSSEEFSAINDTVVQNINDIQPENEYIGFIENYKIDPPSTEQFEFDTSPMNEFENMLKQDEIVLDNLTCEAIEHTHSQIGEELNDLRESLSEKENELKNLEEEIKSIHPTDAQESMIQDLLLKQKAYRTVLKLIGEKRCLEAKLSAQYMILDDSIKALGDEIPSPGIEFNDENRGTTIKPNAQNDSSSGKKLFSIMRPKNKKFNGESAVAEKAVVHSREKPIDEQVWYHGAIPRRDAEVLLVNDGNFLVREKSDASGQYVLSARANNRVRHFPIQVTAEKLYRLEGEAYKSVPYLIYSQLESGNPVTKASQAVLKNGVMRVRDEHDLRHEDIELGDKLGAGHFGDVVRGVLKKNGFPVAVKTCKETVDADSRRKFLMEAKILKQYDHQNIVKLIGVCTDRHPIYIVMELVSGGDLLSYLRSDKNDLNQKVMLRMGENAAAGMAYLEQKNCIHRDLAARNCLVGDKSCVKISDFGMSREEEDGVYSVGGSMRQIPIKWTAPEAMNYGTYTSACDVWSYGILLWEIFSRGSTPYPGFPNNVAREKVEQGYRMSAPHGTPDEVYHIMMSCWEYEPEKRPQFKEVHVTLKRICKFLKA